MVRTLLLVLACILNMAVGGPSIAQAQPVRMAVARLTHGHAPRIWAKANPDIQVVGIFEPNRELASQYARRYGFDLKIVYSDLDEMLDATKPEAVVAFGSIFEHLGVVEAAAPRKIHVMVEKPLAVSLEHALKIEALARRHGIHVLTNYETTWYPSVHVARQMVLEDGAIGPIRKTVFRDGHQGPKEIGVGPEFLEWLTDPVLNGGGALIDFGCYGANLATWMMNGQAPTSVTAVTQQIKPDIYPKVDDNATILLTYPDAEAVIQASWNWPVNVKAMDVYGKTGYILAPDGQRLRYRKDQRSEELEAATPARQAPYQDEWQFLAAVVRGRIKVPDTDLSSLANNVTVVRILDAARRSAREGRTVKLDAAR